MVTRELVLDDKRHAAHELHLPEGTYALEGEDEDYWFLRSGNALIMLDFHRGGQTDRHSLRGGIALGKYATRSVPAAVYIDGQGTDKVLIWKLGKHFRAARAATGVDPSSPALHGRSDAQSDASAIPPKLTAPRSDDFWCAEIYRQLDREALERALVQTGHDALHDQPGEKFQSAEAVEGGRIEPEIERGCGGILRVPLSEKQYRKRE